MTPTPLSDTQLDRIRETITPTVEDWHRDYEKPWDKTSDQLVNRIVASIYAMHQCRVLTVQPIEPLAMA